MSYVKNVRASSITPNTHIYLVRFAYNRPFIQQSNHKKLYSKKNSHQCTSKVLVFKPA